MALPPASATDATVPLLESSSLRSAEQSSTIITIPAANGSTEGESLARAGSLGRTVQAARYLRSGSNRYMREQSVTTREAAHDHLGELFTDIMYSYTVVTIDLVFSLAFLAVIGIVLLFSRLEVPPFPLRVWLFLYSIRCVIHVIYVVSKYHGVREYRRRQAAARARASSNGGSGDGLQSEQEQPPQNQQMHQQQQGEAEQQGAEQAGPRGEGVNQRVPVNGVMKQLEGLKNWFSIALWWLGMCWVFLGLQRNFEKAPKLTWLCTLLLSLDFAFVAFWAMLLFLLVCCCLPCILVFLRAVTEQQGASDGDIAKLPRYTYRPGRTLLSAEDSECCICMCNYEDGVELCQLPCQHHFHLACIDKWLRTKPTCPLCKYNIKGTQQQQQQEQQPASRPMEEP
eukprot:TRINITY_DN2628_c0_g1_i1.p1 TRINITY_DN2628_c0_g1~~TRINITY_DN2628_c0_g1_i1.p1  ORF type:complete len:398 (+),score=85.99 TRINITY_DN2628_c0_g1_i1:243-1436(+)